MKKICLVAVLLMSASVAEARWYSNWNFWGSQDKQKKRHVVEQVHTPPVTPVSVPEPATIILLSLGLGAVSIIKRFKK